MKKPDRDSHPSSLPASHQSFPHHLLRTERPAYLRASPLASSCLDAAFPPCASLLGRIIQLHAARREEDPARLAIFVFLISPSGGHMQERWDLEAFFFGEVVVGSEARRRARCTAGLARVKRSSGRGDLGLQGEVAGGASPQGPTAHDARLRTLPPGPLRTGDMWPPKKTGRRSPSHRGATHPAEPCPQHLRYLSPGHALTLHPPGSPDVTMRWHIMSRAGRPEQATASS